MLIYNLSYGSFFAWFSEAQQKNLSEGLSDEVSFLRVHLTNYH